VPRLSRTSCYFLRPENFYTRICANFHSATGGAYVSHTSRLPGEGEPGCSLKYNLLLHAGGEIRYYLWCPSPPGPCLLLPSFLCQKVACWRWRCRWNAGSTAGSTLGRLYPYEWGSPSSEPKFLIGIGFHRKTTSSHSTLLPLLSPNPTTALSQLTQKSQKGGGVCGRVRIPRGALWVFVVCGASEGGLASRAYFV
jgi:hypothetical protein